MTSIASVIFFGFMGLLILLVGLYLAFNVGIMIGLAVIVAGLAMFAILGLLGR